MPIFGAFTDLGSEPLEDQGSEVRLNVYDIVLHESYPKLVGNDFFLMALARELKAVECNVLSFSPDVPSFPHS